MGIGLASSLRPHRIGQVAQEPPAVGDLDERRPVAVEGLADGGGELLRVACPPPATP